MAQLYDKPGWRKRSYGQERFSRLGLGQLFTPAEFLAHSLLPNRMSSFCCCLLISYFEDEIFETLSIFNTNLFVVGGGGAK